MKELDIAFVILHYLVFEQTKKSIESIKKNVDTKNFLIVVVDNFSNNGSLEKLEQYINGDESVVIVKNQKNLGFANGNNSGINYINKNYDCRFICVLNNDVYLQSPNIFSALNNEYKVSDFAVAGPKIYTKEGRCDSNPKSTNVFSLKNIKHRQIEINLYYFLYKLHLDCLVNLLERRKNHNSVDLNTNKSEKTDKKIYNVQLHGCFYVFSKKYFEFYNGFDDRTFLYMEEEILFQHLLNKKLTSVYLPEIEVFHEEYGSTNVMLNNQTRTKKIFILKHHKNSIKVLLDVMKDN